MAAAPRIGTTKGSGLKAEGCGLFPSLSGASEDDPHLMEAATVDQRDGHRVCRNAVQFGLEHPSTSAVWIRHGNVVAGAEEPPDDLIFGPGRRDARIDDERGGSSAQAEDALQPRPIH